MKKEEKLSKPTRETLHSLVEASLTGVYTDSCSVDLAVEMIEDAFRSYCKETWNT